VQTSGALVHDSALIGPTGPILGQRYRFEVAPVWGELSFATAVADYRRYVMPARPFTVALRVRHVGRYGGDGGDSRLLPLIYHLRDTARGYDTRTVTSQACRDNGDSACSPLELLRTSRVLTTSAELRFPILGAIRGNVSYGPLPVEGFLFTDNAWLWRHGRAGDRATADRWTSLLLRSVGGGVRLSANGLVFELAGARALDVARGWRFAVNFGPGF
jgi:outer membrane protein assembly factor BamA